MIVWDDDYAHYVLYSKDVAENNGKDGKPIWMSYGGMVYDVTDFIHNHPGGSERILLAAGSVSSQCAKFSLLAKLFESHH